MRRCNEEIEEQSQPNENVEQGQNWRIRTEIIDVDAIADGKGLRQ
jgi:hypothetical protein